MSYEDILYLPHHVSKKRAPMSMLDRAAQFAPFAALTGHDALIRETARLTDRPMELTDSARAELDAVLRELREGMAVLVTVFVPDLRKVGGAYVERTGTVRKVDDHGQSLIFTDGTDVPFQFIAKLEVVG
jgi:hypothetical protein